MRNKPKNIRNSQPIINIYITGGNNQIQIPFPLNQSLRLVQDTPSPHGETDAPRIGTRRNVRRSAKRITRNLKKRIPHLLSATPPSVSAPSKATSQPIEALVAIPPQSGGDAARVGARSNASSQLEASLTHLGATPPGVGASRNATSQPIEPLVAISPQSGGDAARVGARSNASSQLEASPTHLGATPPGVGASSNANSAPTSNANTPTIISPTESPRPTASYEDSLSRLSLYIDRSYFLTHYAERLNSCLSTREIAQLIVEMSRDENVPMIDKELIVKASFFNLFLPLSPRCTKVTSDSNFRQHINNILLRRSKRK